MRLLINQAAYRFVVSGPFELRVDFETGAIRKDKKTGFDQHVGQLVGFGSEGAEIFQVVVATEHAPKVSPGDAVNVTGLVAMPWLTKEKELRISFRADSVTPAAVTTSIKAAS